MTITAYAVAVRLVLDDKGIVGPLAQVMEALQRVEAAAKATNEALGEISAALTGAGRAARGFAAAMERAARAAAEVAAAGLDRAVPQGAPATAPAMPTPMPRDPRLNGPEQGFTLGEGSGPTYTGAARPGPFMLGYDGREGPFSGGPGSGGALGPPGTPPRGPIPLDFPHGPRPTVGTDWAEATKALSYEAAIQAYAGYAALRDIFDQGMSLGVARTQFRELGFSDAQSESAIAESDAIRRGVPGASQAAVLGYIKDLGILTQRPQEALDKTALTDIARMGVVLESVGKGDQAEQLFAALQAGELHGELSGKDGQIDTAKLQRFLREVETASIVSGGRIGPAQVLQFLKSSGIAGAMINDERLFADQMAPILSMGAANAGTALQGMMQQFGSGKMSEAAVKLLEEAGIVPPGAAVKVGMGQYRLKPGAMAGYEVLTGTPDSPADPIRFIKEYLEPAARRYDMKTLGYTDQAHEQLFMQLLASRIPGGKYLGDILRNYPLIMRDREAMGAGQTRDAFGIAEQSPQVQLAQMQAAFHAMMAALGDAAMPAATAAMRSLTDALNRIDTWAKAHPEAAADALKALAGAVAAFAGASAAGIALRVLTNPVGGLIGLATGIGMLGASFSSLPKWLIDIALGAAIGGRVGGAPGAAAGAVGGAIAAEVPHSFTEAMKLYRWATHDIWHRETWANPNGSWLFAAPAADDPRRSQDGPVPVIVLNGRDIANGLTDWQTQQLSRAVAGPTGYDLRNTRQQPGGSPTFIGN